MVDVAVTGPYGERFHEVLTDDALRVEAAATRSRLGPGSRGGRHAHRLRPARVLPWCQYGHRSSALRPGLRRGDSERPGLLRRTERPQRPRGRGGRLREAHDRRIRCGRGRDRRRQRGRLRLVDEGVCRDASRRPSVQRAGGAFRLIRARPLRVAVYPRATTPATWHMHRVCGLRRGRCSRPSRSSRYRRSRTCSSPPTLAAYAHGRRHQRLGESIALAQTVEVVDASIRGLHPVVLTTPRRHPCPLAKR
jgi:hypothetical protein